MANVFELFAKIGLDDSEFKSGLNDAKGSLSSFGGAVAKGAKSIVGAGAKIVGAASAAATATSAALVKGASETAAYGDNIDKMSQKMGLSAQAYQEWDAIMQHSGTSIDSMARGMTTLSKAAENNSDAFQKLGITQEELASMSQEELFAKTISGLQSMESGTERTVLAQQLLGGSAKELGALLNTSAEETEAMRERVHELGGVMSDEAVKASAQFQDNLQDMQTAIEGVKRGISSELMPGLSELMVGFTELVAGEEGANEAISQGFNSLIEGFGNVVSGIAEVAQQILPTIVEVITTNLPTLLQSGVEIVGTIGEGLLQTLPSLIESASQVIPIIIQGITDNIPTLVPAIVNVIMSIGQMLTDNLPTLVNAAAQIILSLAQGIGNALPDLVPAIVDVVISIVETLIDNVDLLVDAAIAIITGLAEGLINALPKLIEKAPKLIMSLVEALIRNAPKLLKAAVEIIAKLVTGIVEGIPKIVESGVQLIGDFVGALLGGLGDVVAACSEIVGEIVDAFIGLPAQAVEWGADLIGGFLDGILGAAGALWDGVCGIAEGVADFLGFSEPEKGPLSNFHTFAPDMMQLFAQGIRDNEDIVTDQIKKSFDFGDIITDQEADLSTGAMPVGGYGASEYNISINVNNADTDQDWNRIAEIVSERINALTNRRVVAMGAV